MGIELVQDEQVISQMKNTIYRYLLTLDDETLETLLNKLSDTYPGFFNRSVPKDLTESENTFKVGMDFFE